MYDFILYHFKSLSCTLCISLESDKIIIRNDNCEAKIYLQKCEHACVYLLRNIYI